MNNEAVRRDFNLSRNVSLQTLETTAASIANAGDSASGFLKAVLSIIIPLPLNFVITYGYFDVDPYVSSWDRRFSGEKRFRVREMAQNVLDHPRRFEVCSEMHRVRGFRLVLCADVLHCIAERAIRTLECILEAERIRGGSDYLSFEPLVISRVGLPRVVMMVWGVEVGGPCIPPHCDVYQLC